MVTGQIKLMLNALLSVFVVLALMFAPVQASVTVAPKDMSGMSASMNMTGCKEQPCPCEKSKVPCDMKFSCAMACVYFQASSKLLHLETITYHDDMVFAFGSNSLLSFEGLPLRRPPRV